MSHILSPKTAPGPPATPWHQGCSSCAAPHPSPARFGTPRALPPAPLSARRLFPGSDLHRQISRDRVISFCPPYPPGGSRCAQAWGLLLHGDPQHFPNIKLAKERLFPGFKPGAAWSNPDQLYIIHGCLLTCSCFLAGVSTDPVKAAAVSPCRLRWLPPCQGFPKTAQLVLELPPFPQCSAPGTHSHHLPLSPCAERGPVLVPSLTRCPAASLPCSQTCSREAGTDPPKRLHS